MVYFKYSKSTSNKTNNQKLLVIFFTLLWHVKLFALYIIACVRLISLSGLKIYVNEKCIYYKIKSDIL